MCYCDVLQLRTKKDCSYTKMRWLTVYLHYQPLEKIMCLIQNDFTFLVHSDGKTYTLYVVFIFLNVRFMSGIVPLWRKRKWWLTLTFLAFSHRLLYSAHLAFPFPLFMLPLVTVITNTNAARLFQKDDVFKAVPTPLSPPPAPSTPVTPATPATPTSSASPGTPCTPNSISPSGIVKRKTGQYVYLSCFFSFSYLFFL